MPVLDSSYLSDHLRNLLPRRGQSVSLYFFLWAKEGAKGEALFIFLEPVLSVYPPPPRGVKD